MLLALLLGFLMAASCGGASAEADALKRVDGLVEEARGKPFGLPDYLRVRDGDGQDWEFSIEATVTFTTSHLQQHKARYEKVSVYYRETANGLSAVRLTD